MGSRKHRTTSTARPASLLPVAVVFCLGNVQPETRSRDSSPEAQSRCNYTFIIHGTRFVWGSEKCINAMKSAQRHCRGSAVVAHNAFQRGVPTAINWFANGLADTT